MPPIVAGHKDPHDGFATLRTPTIIAHPAKRRKLQCCGRASKIFGELAVSGSITDRINRINKIIIDESSEKRQFTTETQRSQRI